MADFALSALSRKRAELAGEIEARQAALGQLRADLVHLDAVIRSFGGGGFVRRRWVRPAAVWPVDIAATRRRLGLSQTEFAAWFGISPGTLRTWEQGRRVPEGPARVLLRVIERDPEAVRRAIN